MDWLSWGIVVYTRSISEATLDAFTNKTVETESAT